MSDDYKFDTLSLHAGHVPDAQHGSRAVPIHQTTSYVFRDSEHAASLYNMELGGHLYTRISNPTVAVLEQRVAALDGDRFHVFEGDLRGGLEERSPLRAAEGAIELRPQGEEAAALG